MAWCCCKHRSARAFTLGARKEVAGEVTYGSVGNGGLLHLYPACIEHQAAVEFWHVHCKGLAPVAQDLVGGSIQVDMAALPVMQAFITSGQLRPLAVTHHRRMKVQPTVPALAEVEYPGYDGTGWMVLVGPAGLPQALQACVHLAVRAALVNPRVADAPEQAATDAIGSGPEETARSLRAGYDKRMATAGRIGLKPQ